MSPHDVNMVNYIPTTHSDIIPCPVASTRDHERDRAIRVAEIYDRIPHHVETD